MKNNDKSPRLSERKANKNIPMLGGAKRILRPRSSFQLSTQWMNGLRDGTVTFTVWSQSQRGQIWTVHDLYYGHAYLVLHSPPAPIDPEEADYESAMDDDMGYDRWTPFQERKEIKVPLPLLEEATGINLFDRSLRQLFEAAEDENEEWWVDERTLSLALTRLFPRAFEYLR